MRLTHVPVLAALLILAGPQASPAAIGKNGSPTNGAPSNGLPSNGTPSNGAPSNGLPGGPIAPGPRCRSSAIYKVDAIKVCRRQLRCATEVICKGESRSFICRCR